VLVAPARLALFLAATVALLVTPGPAVLYIVARSMGQGRRAGLVSVLGIGTGNALHAAASAAGLGLLLASSPLAFAAVRYLGAAYLVGLGLAKLARRPPPARDDGADPDAGAPLQAVFLHGVAVQVLNPKVALFNLAFLPQFVDPAAGPAWRQLLFLGAIFAVLAVLSDCGYALLAGAIGGWLRRHSRFSGMERWLGGAIYLGLGLLAALA
jgi:threonine/homoserine/homoserine lactone efflux protein